MFRVELQRRVELRERSVRLVRVVIRHPEIGADIDVLRRELQRVAVPPDRFVVALGIEIQIAELRAVSRSPPRSATVLSAVTCVSSSTAARVVAAPPDAGACAVGAPPALTRGLLRADDPTGDEAEKDAGDSECDRV
jgi:hypothetical protein